MQKTLVVALLIWPGLAFAHSGHAEGTGGFWAGMSHPLGGLDHLLAMLAVGIWAGAGVRGGRWALPLSFLAAMASGAALALAGIALPMIEAGILASVVVIGALVALALRPGLISSAALVALFGLFHGQAHGLEAPEGGIAAYAAGFLLATAGLHLAGIGLGRLPMGRWIGGAVALAGLALAAA